VDKLENSTKYSVQELTYSDDAECYSGTFFINLEEEIYSLQRSNFVEQIEDAIFDNLLLIED